MLTSITPLGERGRGSRWPVTIGFYVAGSAAGGALVGGLLGAAGAGMRALGVPPVSLAGALVVVAGVLVVGGLLDARVGGAHLPTVHRQVDEDWLGRYRGWVYGLGFGFQLGAGVVTIVTTSTVYALWLLTVLVGSPGLGAGLGAAFGVVRALPALATSRVVSFDGLSGFMATLERWRERAHRLTLAGQAALAVALVGVVVA